MWRQRGALLGNPVEPLQRLLPVVVEILVFRFPLAKTHSLDVGYEQFHLVVGHVVNTIQQAVCLGILHLGQFDEDDVVVGFGNARSIIGVL